MSYREIELPHRYAFNKHHRGGSSAREEMVEIVLEQGWRLEPVCRLGGVEGVSR